MHDVLAAGCPSAVACTKNLAPLLEWKCLGCGGDWHVTDVVLKIYGQIYAFNGNPKTMHLHIVDPTVDSFASAIAHEHAWHINIALRAVDTMIKQFEGKHFGSEDECNSTGAYVRGDVLGRFNYWYRETQNIENRGGDPRSVPIP